MDSSLPVLTKEDFEKHEFYEVNRWNSSKESIFFEKKCENKNCVLIVRYLVEQSAIDVHLQFQKTLDEHGFPKEQLILNRYRVDSIEDVMNFLGRSLSYKMFNDIEYSKTIINSLNKIVEKMSQLYPPIEFPN